jgi:RNA-directed DNA polymerase
VELLKGNTEDAVESRDVSTKQQQIARLARIHLELSFTSLAYHIDRWWLLEAYRRTRKGGAVGVDGQTAEEYAKALGANLRCDAYIYRRARELKRVP